MHAFAQTDPITLKHNMLGMSDAAVQATSSDNCNLSPSIALATHAEEVATNREETQLPQPQLLFDSLPGLALTFQHAATQSAAVVMVDAGVVTEPLSTIAVPHHAAIRDMYCQTESAAHEQEDQQTDTIDLVSAHIDDAATQTEYRDTVRVNGVIMCIFVTNHC